MTGPPDTRRVPGLAPRDSSTSTLPSASIEIQDTTTLAAEEATIRRSLGAAAAPELSKAEAVKLTAEIKAWAGTLWQKLKQAHDGKAWKPMGYTSWAEYLSVEFDISRSRGYQLIAHANAVAELADAAGGGMSTMVDIPERVTRGMDVASVSDVVRDRVADLPAEPDDEDRARALHDAMAEHQKKRPAKKAKPKATRAPDYSQAKRRTRTHEEMFDTLVNSLEGIVMAFEDIRCADDIEGLTRGGAGRLSLGLVAPMKDLHRVVDALDDRGRLGTTTARRAVELVERVGVDAARSVAEAVLALVAADEVVTR